MGLKIMSVVGARPNFMKVAPIIAAINKHNQNLKAAYDSRAGHERIHHVLVHTGQHYDQQMSDSFFTDLGLPHPDVHLSVGSGSHAAQTGDVMKRFEPVLVEHEPDVLVVVGDVNSTLACALVAAKISFDSSDRRPLIAHVEAGLRSFDRTMPEELNRVLTDQLADLLFVTEESGFQNLKREGIPADAIHFVGNTMIDSLLACREKAEKSTVLDDLGLRVSGSDGASVSPYALLTLHRPANVDNRVAFINILAGLRELAGQCDVVFPIHPRTRKRIAEFGLKSYFRSNGDGVGTIRMIEPLGYLDFFSVMRHAALVVTDSGGVQEETTCLGVPCVTVRNNTERPATVDVGTNLLGGVETEGIRFAIRQQLRSPARGRVPDKWDGKAAGRIIAVVCREAAKRAEKPPNELLVQFSDSSRQAATSTSTPQGPAASA